MSKPLQTAAFLVGLLLIATVTLTGGSPALMAIAVTLTGLPLWFAPSKHRKGKGDPEPSETLGDWNGDGVISLADVLHCTHPRDGEPVIVNEKHDPGGKPIKWLCPDCMDEVPRPQSEADLDEATRGGFVSSAPQSVRWGARGTWDARVKALREALRDKTREIDDIASAFEVDRTSGDIVMTTRQMNAYRAAVEEADAIKRAIDAVPEIPEPEAVEVRSHQSDFPTRVIGEPILTAATAPGPILTSNPYEEAVRAAPPRQCSVYREVGGSAPGSVVRQYAPLGTHWCRDGNCQPLPHVGPGQWTR